MATTTTDKLLTTEEMLDLADDDVRRELFEGILQERPMTRRNRGHSRTEARIAHVLLKWLESFEDPPGDVVSGEAGFRLRRDPDTSVGIDVAYVSRRVASQDVESAYFEGPPTLAVEILSPSDTQEDIHRKIRAYLQSGVPLVWVVDPEFRTVTCFRPDGPPTLFGERDELVADPHLPGFRVPVARLFGK